MDLKINGHGKKLIGEINVPGDKSISHRSIIIGSLAKGKTIIENILMSEDSKRTIDCFKQMGVKIEESNGTIYIEGSGLHGLDKPTGFLDCGNSGTTMRLLSGVLVGQKFSTSLIGDESLMNRPMKRIIMPLRKMGGNISGREDEYPPIDIKPTEKLNGINYQLPIASAQVKSSILLATLYSKGVTKIIENKTTRDHTERMLNYFGCNIIKKGSEIIMDQKPILMGKKLYVPGDISSASFFIVAASLMEGSNITIKNVGINPTRIGIISVLKDMGADIKILNKRILNNEPIGDIKVKHSYLHGIEISEDIIGTLIDEIPIIAVAATLAKGKTIIKNIEELKYKESNRIEAITTELNKMGARIKELPDGMTIEGIDCLKPANIYSYNDHRIAMALSIAALRAEGESFISGYQCVNVSYPNFYETLFNLIL
jgi:3-phosphoshikimate 1-carboxyvinyltransferase